MCLSFSEFLITISLFFSSILFAVSFFIDLVVFILISYLFYIHRVEDVFFRVLVLVLLSLVVGVPPFPSFYIEISFLFMLNYLVFNNSLIMLLVVFSVYSMFFIQMFVVFYEVLISVSVEYFLYNFNSYRLFFLLGFVGILFSILLVFSFYVGVDYY